MTDPSKIKPSHTQRAVDVYIRQSWGRNIEQRKRYGRRPVAATSNPRDVKGAPPVTSH